MIGSCIGMAIGLASNLGIKMDINLLHTFYTKHSKEKIEELKPFFDDFVNKVDYASMIAFSMFFEDVKRAIFVRDTLKVYVDSENDIDKSRVDSEQAVTDFEELTKQAFVKFGIKDSN